MSRGTHLAGPRTKGVASPDEVVGVAEASLKELRNGKLRSEESVAELKSNLAHHCRAYYHLAAASRRQSIGSDTATGLRRRLFALRAAIELAILDGLDAMPCAPLACAAQPTLFGSSAKQGVSIRYPLLVCVPTVKCGGGCYAHDGRDREVNHIFRGVLNFWLGRHYETSGPTEREGIIRQLGKALDYGVAQSRADAARAAAAGFVRSPRIRFAHVGEMVATPEFLHRLAREVKARAPKVECVLYTRHPNAAFVDTSLFVVNFTLEGPNDPRRRFVPAGAHIVASAWDGRLMEDAHVNFLEHHVEKKASSVGDGFVCPVNLAPPGEHSCDSVGCDRCFRPSGTGKPGLCHLRMAGRDA